MSFLLFLKKNRSKFLLLGGAITFFLLVGVTLIAGINFFVIRQTQFLVFRSSQDIPPKQVAIVLGAKVHEDGRLSDMLRDRAQTAVELYQNKKVEKILVTGDHGRKNYDEVNAIRHYLQEKGVANQDIFLDHAGFDTYDSLYRARDIFQIKSATIVTQAFHLNRSLFIGKNLGLDVQGVIADKQEYWGITRSRIREIFSRVKALVDVLFAASPKFLGESIPITGDSKKSWDQQ